MANWNFSSEISVTRTIGINYVLLWSGQLPTISMLKLQWDPVGIFQSLRWLPGSVKNVKTYNFFFTEIHLSVYFNLKL